MNFWGRYTQRVGECYLGESDEDRYDDESGPDSTVNNTQEFRERVDASEGRPPTEQRDWFNI